MIELDMVGMVNVTSALVIMALGMSLATLGHDDQAGRQDQPGKQSGVLASRARLRKL